MEVGICFLSITGNIVNQVFQRKTLVIKMMNVGRQAGRRVVGRTGVNNSFLEQNSTTVRNIFMIFGRVIEQDSAE